MEAILDFLNQPIVKAAMVFVGTFILRAWPRFVNEAVPMWTGIYSVVTAILGGLFPDNPPTALHGGLVVAAVAGSSWWENILVAVVRDGLLPWLAGFGGARATDQTKKHVTGAVIGGDAPAKHIQMKPFQMLLTPNQEKKVIAAKED